ncbi:MAG: dephospho-CoA kinase [Halanaerobiales bacterium]|nr:dephospho-CoA kinase [Halanaerobiales bacterium]
MIIGLTGGIASGKSTVSKILKGAGACVIDADQIVHQLLARNHLVRKQVVDYFGPSIVSAAGGIDRTLLGEIIFADDDKRKQLEKIIHPLVIRKMETQLANHQEREKHIILDIPLLYETKLDYLVEQVWVVYVEPEVQLQRLLNRGQLSKAEAIKRIKTQLPLSEKKEMADLVIDNNGSRRELKAKVLEHWREINEGEKNSFNRS